MIRVYKYLIRNVDMESRVFSTPWGTHLHLDEIQKWLPSDILMERRKFGKQLLELNLTAQEESVIRAIIIVSSGLYFCVHFRDIRVIIQKPLPWPSGWAH